MASITALNVRLGMDASNFAEGADLARKEVNRVASIMRQSEPPAEKFKREVELLNKAFSESGRQSREYANAVEHLRQKYGQVPQAIKPTRQELEFLARAEKQAADDNRFLAQVMEASTPKVKRFEADVQRLNALWPASKRGSDQYALALEHLRQKHGQLTPSVRTARQTIQQMTSSMLTAVPGAHMLGTALSGPLGVALALGASLAVSTRALKKSAQQIDETAKAARALGTTYRDLVAIQMMASEVGGIDNQTLTRGLQQFVRRLADARANGGRLAETMKAIGLNTAELAAMDPGKAFRLVSDAIKDIPDEAEQIRIASELVGREGVKLVEVFRQGGSAVDAMATEAERLGAVVSDAAARDVEAMNDAFGRAKMAITGMSNSAIADLAPALTNIARLVEEIAVGFRSTENSASGVGDALEPVITLITKMLEGFRFINAVTADIRSNLAFVPHWMQGGGWLGEFEATNRLLDEMDAKASGFGESTKDATAAAEALAIETERAAEASRQLEESFEKRIRDLQIESIALAGNTEEAERLRLMAEGYSDEQAKVLLAMQQQNESIKERIDLEKKAAEEAEREAKRRQAENEKRMAEAKKKMEEVEKAFEVEVSQAMQAAQQFFEAERKRDEERRKAMSEGPESMEVGSAAAAKFMADQANRAMAIDAVPERPTPGEKEIADKTRELLVAQREANVAQTKELETMKELLTEFRQNGFRRLR